MNLVTLILGCRAHHEDIGKKLAMAEQVGAEGKVEESMKLMEEVSRALEFQTAYVFLMRHLISSS